MTGTPGTSRAGHRCPPWCTTIHDEDHGAHWGSGTAVRLRGRDRYAIPDPIMVNLVHTGSPGAAPMVAVMGVPAGAGVIHLWLAPGDARKLSGIIEMLATATTGQRRELAAAIRKAGADITGEGGDGR